MSEAASNPALRTPLAAGLAALGLALPEAARARLLEYVALLVKWNGAYNLTAVRDPAEMVTKHLLDSLSVAPHVRGPRVLDVGTGAGLPGIPLAVAFPEHRFVLLDSNGKKTRFVTHAAATLGLHNVEIVQARVEDYRPVEPFDTVITRAFAALPDFLRATVHIGGRGGRWLAMKGERPGTELKALPTDFRLIAVHPLTVPGLDAQRCVAEIIKL